MKFQATFVNIIVIKDRLGQYDFVVNLGRECYITNYYMYTYCKETQYMHIYM